MSGTPKKGYFTKDGEKVPSVTTILSARKDCGGLMWWAWQQGKAGLDFREVRDSAAKAGTLAHDMVEAYVHGETIPSFEEVDADELKKAERAFDAFKEWADQTQLVVTHSEMQLVSEQHKYGGTPDAILVHGRRALGDWKTSGSVYCHTPNTRVLTHDWRWVPVGDLAVGDRIRAFTENRVAGGLGGRQWQDAEVVRTGLAEAKQGIRIILESGRELVSTTDHPYLARRSAGGRAMTEGGTIWLTAEELRVGNLLPRYFDPWDVDTSYEAGWLAGLLDGEGSLSVGKRRAYKSRLGFSQKTGAVLDRAKRVMDTLGIRYSEHINQRGIANVTINGGVREVARVIGAVRPARLLPLLNPQGAMMTPAGCRDKIVAIERVGPIEVVNLTTSSGTYFAEGYGSHNTEYLMQLAAYGKLWEENFPDEPITGGYHLIRFDKEYADFHHHYWAELDAAWRGFLLLREMYEIDRELKQRCK